MDAGCLATTPSRSARCFEPAMTSTPVLETPEPLSPSEDPTPEASDIVNSVEDIAEAECRNVYKYHMWL